MYLRLVFVLVVFEIALAVAPIPPTLPQPNPSDLGVAALVVSFESNLKYLMVDSMQLGYLTNLQLYGSLVASGGAGLAQLQVAAINPPDPDRSLIRLVILRSQYPNDLAGTSTATWNSAFNLLTSPDWSANTILKTLQAFSNGAMLILDPANSAQMSSIRFDVQYTCYYSSPPLALRSQAASCPASTVANAAASSTTFSLPVSPQLGTFMKGVFVDSMAIYSSTCPSSASSLRTSDMAFLPADIPCGGTFPTMATTEGSLSPAIGGVNNFAQVTCQPDGSVLVKSCANPGMMIRDDSSRMTLVSAAPSCAVDSYLGLYRSQCLGVFVKNPGCASSTPPPTLYPGQPPLTPMPALFWPSGQPCSSSSQSPARVGIPGVQLQCLPDGSFQLLDCTNSQNGVVLPPTTQAGCVSYGNQISYESACGYNLKPSDPTPPMPTPPSSSSTPPVLAMDTNPAVAEATIKLKADLALVNTPVFRQQLLGVVSRSISLDQLVEWQINKVVSGSSIVTFSVRTNSSSVTLPTVNPTLQAKVLANELQMQASSNTSTLYSQLQSQTGVVVDTSYAAPLVSTQTQCPDGTWQPVCPAPAPGPAPSPSGGNTGGAGSPSPSSSSSAGSTAGVVIGVVVGVAVLAGAVWWYRRRHASNQLSEEHESTSASVYMRLN